MVGLASVKCRRVGCIEQLALRRAFRALILCVRPSDLFQDAHIGEVYTYEKHGLVATRETFVTDNLGTHVDPPW